ncbi:MAG TPA: LLM class flavin-dependent oxidoreductase [Acidimicrobiales bacterium]|jgi:alkanesulfonate monooxygenase SsuD/methylene tetrahydromethanopterin reductase-like flavin-dependent oxidoreductase (luciferase family)|nr:LLM class flavin-dependent oxidoreductase [Acidimicrobiales bacterium]
MYQLRFSMRTPAEGRPAAEEAAARTAAYQAAVDMVAWGEQHGNVAAVLSEHHASPDGYLPSPLILASAMAARTQSTTIVIAALLGLLYDPVRLAEDLAVLDHVSGGRVMCVLGMGYRDDEYRLYGVDGETRADQMEELLTTLNRAWTGEPFDHPTRGTIRVTPTPGGTGRPPLAYGGHSLAAARRAARHGLVFLAETGGDHLQVAYEQEARRLGIDAPGCRLTAPGTATTAFVSDDLDAAWDELGPRMLQEIRLYRDWNRVAGKSDIASLSEADTVDELRAEQGGYRVYTSAEAADLAASGELLPLEPLCGGLPPERAWHYLRAAAAAVAPR